MAPARQIIGVCLVRDEDRFLEQALTNVFGFCDRIVIADHQSRDRTAEIGQRWAAAFPKVEYHRVSHPGASHEMARSWAGTPSWLLGVDGDELYDPARLAPLREEILAGRFERYRQIYGHALHCDEIDTDRNVAWGYMTPPCRTMTKFYNFNALVDWQGPCPERFHGGHLVFRDGYTADMNREFHKETSWDDSPFRCLHVVFLRRSSRQPDGVARLNISEKNSRPWPARLLDRLRRGPSASSYKYEKYRRGERMAYDVKPFFEKKVPLPG